MKFQNLDTRQRRGSYGDLTSTVLGSGKEAINVIKAKVPKRGKDAKMTYNQREAQGRMATLMGSYKGLRPMLDCPYKHTKSNQTDGDLFVQKNYHVDLPLLTREQAAQGYQLLSNFIISDYEDERMGSIEVTTYGGKHIFGVKLGDLVIGPQTTVQQFSRAVIDNNDGFQEGDALLVLVAYQMLPVGKAPAKIGTRWDKVKLATHTDDPESQRLLADAAPHGLFRSTEVSMAGGARAQFLYHEARDYEMVAPVHSRCKRDKTTVCSRQQFVGRNPYLAEFAAAQTKNDAVFSYGPVQHANYYNPSVSLPGDHGFTLRDFIAEQAGQEVEEQPPETGSGSTGNGGSQGGSGSTGNGDSTGGGNNGGGTSGKVRVTVTGNMTSGVEFIGSGEYTPGEQVEIQAKVLPGSALTFDRWKDGSTQNPRTITVPDHDITYTAELVIEMSK